MAKKEYHTDQTEGATPFGLIPSAFMTMGRQHIHECVEAHSELVNKFQAVNRSWLQYLRSEADLSAEFTPKMMTARSIPGAATVLFGMDQPTYGHGGGRRQACPGRHTGDHGNRILFVAWRLAIQWQGPR